MTDNNHQIKNFTSTTDSLKYSTYTHREKSGKHAGHIISPHKVMTLPEVESRTKGSRPRSRSRTPKNFEAKDRPSRGQGQGPRTQTQVFSPQKKRLSKFFFRRSQKKVFKNFFSGDLYLRKPKKRSLKIFHRVSGVFQRNFSGSKIVLSSSRGQGNFRGLEALRPRPRTSKCVLEDVLEAKNVLEDSTSGRYST